MKSIKRKQNELILFGHQGVTKVAIIESPELEGNFKSHPVQFLCNGQEHLQLDQVAQSPMKPDLGVSLQLTLTGAQEYLLQNR